MGADGIIEKASTRFTLKDVEDRRVEAVSVIALDELETLVSQQVEERTRDLERELEELRARLAEAEAGGGGLEAAAADAALQAEAAALEAKAAAELRADQAEARVKELEASVEELKARAGDGARVAELEARIKELEAAAAAAPAKPAAPPAKPAAPAKPGETPAAAAPAKPKAPVRTEPVSAGEHAWALRTAKGLIEDIVNEDEDSAREAIKAGRFRSEFESALTRARQSYERRVKADVRAERDHWEQALKELEAGQ